MTNKQPSVEEIANELARSIESLLVHKLQIETMSTKGQSTEYRKGLRDMRYLVMENCGELAQIELLPTLQAERQRCDEMVEKILSLAPGFKNTKTGEVTYDVGVMEWQARIEALIQPNNK